MLYGGVTSCTCFESEDVTALACCMRWLWFVAAEDDEAEPEDTAEPEDALWGQDGNECVDEMERYDPKVT